MKRLFHFNAFINLKILYTKKKKIHYPQNDVYFACENIVIGIAIGKKEKCIKKCIKRNYGRCLKKKRGGEVKEWSEKFVK